MAHTFVIRKCAAAAAGIALAASLAACGSSAGTDTKAAGDANASQSTGEPLKFGSDISNAPWEYFENGKAVGIDVEVAEAIGRELGRPVEWVNVSFDSLIPGLTANRFDAVISSMYDTEERQKVVSFVDYASPYPTIIVKKGNPSNVQSPSDLCGLSVVQVQAAVQVGYVQKASDECVTAGKPAVNLVQVGNSGDVNQVLKNGRAEATIGDLVATQLAVKALGDGFELVKASGIPSPRTGIAVKKSDKATLESIQSALQKVADSGALVDIAKKHDLPGDIFLSKITTNLGSN